MSLSYESDDRRRKFLICIKKFEKDLFIEKERELDENDKSRSRELDQNKVCALFCQALIQHHVIDKCGPSYPFRNKVPYYVLFLAYLTDVCYSR
jgi:hypothetical protein